VPAPQRKPSRQRVYVEADIYARIELQRRERPRSFGDYLQVAVDAPAVSRAPPRGRRFGPDYAEAHAALGSMQLAMLFGSPLSPRHIVPKGESAAREAVELDETPWLPHQMLSSALSCDTLRRHVAIGPRRCGSREASPFIAANFRVTSNPRETGIGGTSLGGVAALYVLLNRPDRFGIGLLESPTLPLGNGQMLRDTTFLARGPDRVYIGVGTTELAVPGGDSSLISCGCLSTWRTRVSRRWPKRSQRS
jgi:hypothetical protein